LAVWPCGISTIHRPDVNPNIEIQGLTPGHVPVPYSGNFNLDGHDYHFGAWPADVFYGDMDGVWTDSSVTQTIASDPRNWNVPGDGKFDMKRTWHSWAIRRCECIP
jgi:hypothetical protein